MEIIGFGNNDILVSYQNNNSSSYDKPISISKSYTTKDSWTSSRDIRCFADVNGDNKQDFIGFGASSVYVATYNKAGTLDEGSIVVNDLSKKQGWTVIKHPRTVADVDGDGKIDLVGFGGSAVFVSFGNGDGSFEKPQRLYRDFTASKGWGKETPRKVADINNDNKADLVAFGKDGVYVALSNGRSGFGSKTKVSDSFCSDKFWKTDKNERILSDLNGDGNIDIIGFGGSKVYCAYGDGGGGFGDNIAIDDNFSNKKSWDVRTVADINNDGLADLVGFDGVGVKVAYQQNGTYVDNNKNDLSPPTNPTPGSTNNNSGNNNNNVSNNNPATAIPNKHILSPNYQLSELIGEKAKGTVVASLAKKSESDVYMTFSANQKLTTLFQKHLLNQRLGDSDFSKYWHQKRNYQDGEVVANIYYDDLMTKEKVSDEVYTTYWNEGGRLQIVKAFDDRRKSLYVLDAIEGILETYHEKIESEIDAVKDNIIFDRIESVTKTYPEGDFTGTLIKNSLNLISLSSDPVSSKVLTIGRFFKAGLEELNRNRGQTIQLSGDFENNNIRDKIFEFKRIYSENAELERKALAAVRKAILNDATLLAQLAKEYDAAGISDESSISNSYEEEMKNNKVQLQVRKLLLDAILPMSGVLYGIPVELVGKKAEIKKKIDGYSLQRDLKRPKNMDDVIARSVYKDINQKAHLHHWYLGIGGINRQGINDVIPTLLNNKNYEKKWEYILEAYDGNTEEIFDLIIPNWDNEQLDNNKFYYTCFVDSKHPNKKGGWTSKELRFLYRGFLTNNGTIGKLPPSLRNDYSPYLRDPEDWYVFSKQKASTTEKEISRIYIEFTISDGTDSKIGMKVKYRNKDNTLLTSKLSVVYTDFISGDIEDDDYEAEKYYTTIDDDVYNIDEIHFYTDQSGINPDLILDKIVVKINAHQTFSPNQVIFNNPQQVALDGEENMIIFKIDNTVSEHSNNLTTKEQESFDKADDGGY